MTCAPAVGKLVRHEAKDFNEFRTAFEDIRVYVLARNEGKCFSDKLTNDAWRERKVNKLFKLYNEGASFSSLTNKSIFREVVQRNGKNEKYLDFIAQHIVPHYMTQIQSNGDANLLNWVKLLNAACIDPVALQHQIDLQNGLPEPFAGILLQGRKEIGTPMWKTALEGFISGHHIHTMAQLVKTKTCKDLAAQYFVVRAHMFTYDSPQTKEALLLKLSGDTFPTGQLTYKEDMVNGFIAEYQEGIKLGRYSPEILKEIIHNLDVMKNVLAVDRMVFYAYQYLVLVSKGGEYTEKFRETISYGLERLSQDPIFANKP